MNRDNAVRAMGIAFMMRSPSSTLFNVLFFWVFHNDKRYSRKERPHLTGGL
jgi:hypothetical protein